MRGSSAPDVRFTDEELMLLSAGHPLVDTPYLSTLDEAQRTVATEVAYRSLCSHGAVAINGGAGMELPETVVTVLQMRASARQILLVSKSTADVEVLRYHHFGSDSVVLEDVSDDGIHDFRVIREDDLHPELEAFCTVVGSVDARGEPITLTEGSFRPRESVSDVWGEGVAQFDATIWRAGAADPGNPLVIGFVLGTTGSWCSQRSLQSESGSGVELLPIAASQVSDVIVRELLDPPVDEPGQVRTTSGKVRRSITR
jgi:hypothetical protein